MLDAETKRRINSARDTLVGVVPDPKSQVEQITIALMYKFMDDIDAESEELGGKRKFFAGDFERYGWAKLMSPRIGGQETLNLYAEGIEKIPQNPGVPMLFRDIFKSAYLPYRNPETLKGFLKIIDEFEYDHSERLGDAFEYLLSVLGAQGDAGQFRTPRHIIDFIVEILDPKKDETILDPACGTAGFLISAYKHIKRANTDKDGNDKLTPAQRQKLADNIKGYDISPDMVRLSLVNLYLHDFAAPHIYDYDTLTSDEKWNEYYDVILANPPFMSPRGGIRPHNRFSVKSSRSEVLFVDYIAEHLTPNGRAGIIVPEGIIFQSQNAYKQLRKMLVENYLVAVVSLPAGVFQPYAGVKTSILILDRMLAKQTDTIGFFKIENDGFDLGATRREIEKNDLPQAKSGIHTYLRHDKSKFDSEKPQLANGLIVEKEKISEDGSYNLTYDRYRVITDNRDVKWQLLKLKELEETNDITLGRGKVISKIDLGKNPGRYPVYSASAQGIGKFGQYGDYMFDEELITWSVDSGGRFFYRPRHKFSVTNVSGWLRVNNSQKINAKYLFRALDTEWRKKRFDYVAKAHPSVIREVYEIPLPPLEIQQEIVSETDGYQKVIDGARMVIDNYRPHIPINPDWPAVELCETCNLYQPKTISQKELVVDGAYLVFGANGIIGRYDKYNHEDPEVLITCRGATCGTINMSKPKSWVTGNAMVATPKTSRIIKEFLFVLLKNSNLSSTISGSAQPQITRQGLAPFQVRLPPLEIQQEIVAEIETEQSLVDTNRELIQRMEKKIQSTIARVWGE